MRCIIFWTPLAPCLWNITTPWTTSSYANTHRVDMESYLHTQWRKQHAKSGYLMENKNTILVYKGEDFYASPGLGCLFRFVTFVGVLVFGIDLIFFIAAQSFESTPLFQLLLNSVCTASRLSLLPMIVYKKPGEGPAGSVAPDFNIRSMHIDILSVWSVWQIVCSGFLTDFARKFVHVMWM